MSANTWHEELPSDASAVGLSPPDFKSLWTSIAVGISSSLYWPGSGGASQASAGEIVPGATRTFHGALSVSSNQDGHLGRLFLSSDSSFLFLYESGATHKIGGAGTLSQGSQPLGGLWVEQRGSVSNISEGQTPGNSLGTAYSVAPQIWLVPSSASYLVSAVDVNTSEFTISALYVGPGAETSATVYWTSLGTVAIGGEI